MASPFSSTRSGPNPNRRKPKPAGSSPSTPRLEPFSTAYDHAVSKFTFNTPAAPSDPFRGPYFANTIVANVFSITDTRYKHMDIWLSDAKKYRHYAVTQLNFKPYLRNYPAQLIVQPYPFGDDFTDIGMCTLLRAPVSSTWVPVKSSSNNRILCALIPNHIVAKANSPSHATVRGKMRSTVHILPNGKFQFNGSYPILNSYDRNMVRINKEEMRVVDTKPLYGVPIIKTLSYNARVPAFSGMHTAGLSAWVNYPSYCERINEIFGEFRNNRILQSVYTKYGYHTGLNAGTTPTILYNHINAHGIYDAYGDWFNYYAYNIPLPADTKTPIHHPTFAGMQHKIPYEGIHHFNYYLDTCVYYDKSMYDKTGLVMYDVTSDAGTTMLDPYVIVLQNTHQYEYVHNYNNDGVVLHYRNIYDSRAEPIPSKLDDIAKLNAIWGMPSRHNSSQNVRDGIDYNDIYISAPFWNLHEMSWETNDERIGQNHGLKILEIKKGVNRETFYSGSSDTGILSSAINSFFKQYSNWSGDFRKFMNESGLKWPYGNVYTPHLTEMCITNQTMFHCITKYDDTKIVDIPYDPNKIRTVGRDDAEYVDACDFLKSKLKTYMGKVLCEDYNVTRKEQPFTSIQWADIYSDRGKYILNTVRHTSRSFLNGRYTPYFDYMPLCYNVIGFLDTIALAYNHYGEGANIRTGQHKNDMSVDIIHERIIDRPSGDYRFAPYEYVVESVLFGNTIRRMHHDIIAAEIRQFNEQNPVWTKYVNYHLDLLTYHAMMLEDPSLHAYMGHDNPYNTNIVEMEVISKITMMALDKLLKATNDNVHSDNWCINAFRVLSSKTYADSNDRYPTGRNVVSWVFWPTYKRYVWEIWDEYRRIHPPFSIDNTPIHSSINERIRHDIVRKKQRSMADTEIANIVAGRLHIENDVYDLVYSGAKKNKDGVLLNGISNSVYKNSYSTFYERIYTFEKQIVENYSVRVFKNKNSSTGHIKHPSRAIFVHVSAYQSILRWANMSGVLSAGIVRASLDENDQSTIFAACIPAVDRLARVVSYIAEDIMTGETKSFLQRDPTYSETMGVDPIGTGYYIGDFSKFGVINDTNSFCRPYFVLRNSLYIKSEVGINPEYELSVYFYTESTAVKYKDELMREYPTQSADMSPLHVIAPTRLSNDIEIDNVMDT